MATAAPIGFQRFHRVSGGPKCNYFLTSSLARLRRLCNARSWLYFRKISAYSWLYFRKISAHSWLYFRKIVIYICIVFNSIHAMFERRLIWSSSFKMLLRRSPPHAFIVLSTFHSIMSVSCLRFFKNICFENVGKNLFLAAIMPFWLG